MKRDAPIVLVAVCIGTSVLYSNCSGPLGWLSGGGKYGAESWLALVRETSARDTLPGSEAYGMVSSVLAGGVRLGLDALSCWSRRVLLVGVAVHLQEPGLYWSVPTRLETRTKESNMCASVRVVNPDAQRNREEGPVYGAPPAAPDLL